jgi:outer membrane protein assembly factor BamB
MPRDPKMLFFVGIKSSILAFDERTGAEVWRTKLKGSDFVTVLWDGEALLAANGGEIFRLEPQTGAVMWHNELKGFGRGVVSLASTRAPQVGTRSDPNIASKRRDQQQAAAAGAAAAAG